MYDILIMFLDNEEFEITDADGYCFYDVNGLTTIRKGSWINYIRTKSIKRMRVKEKATT